VIDAFVDLLGNRLATRDAVLPAAAGKPSIDKDGFTSLYVGDFLFADHENDAWGVHGSMRVFVRRIEKRPCGHVVGLVLPMN
jgi:hypothetical protein